MAWLKKARRRGRCAQLRPRGRAGLTRRPRTRLPLKRREGGGFGCSARVRRSVVLHSARVARTERATKRVWAQTALLVHVDGLDETARGNVPRVSVGVEHDWDGLAHLHLLWWLGEASPVLASPVLASPVRASPGRRGLDASFLKHRSYILVGTSTLCPAAGKCR